MDATKLSSEALHVRLAVANEVSAEMGRQGRISGQRLAADSGVPYRTLMRCLSGDRPFSVDELAEIARALRVPIGHFLVTAGGGSARGAFAGSRLENASVGSPTGASCDSPLPVAA